MMNARPENHQQGAARERQARTIEAMRDFLERTARGKGTRRPARRRPAERAGGLFDGTNRRTGTEER
jgi:hypothetical protein